LFTYEEVLRLNQDESNPESLLAFPRIVLTDEAGNFYLDDVRDNRIVSFDASGNYLRTIGREGAGPGEYQSVMLACLHRDLLVITDAPLNRVSIFRTDGAFVNSFPLPAREGQFIPWEIRLGPADERILLGEVRRTGEDWYRFERAVARVFSAAGDSLTSLASEDIWIGRRIRLEQYNALDFATRYFTVSPTILYHPRHGLVVADGLEPRLQCFDLLGHLRKVIRVNFPPEAVTEAEKRAVRTYHREQIQAADDMQSRIISRKVYEYVEYQDPKAYFGIEYIDEYGYIWAVRPDLGLSNDLFNREVRNVRLLFSPEGEYLGETTLPHLHARPTRGRMICVQDDVETGAVEVVVYALRPLPAGFEYP
jgi:hypothetical protein